MRSVPLVVLLALQGELCKAGNLQNWLSGVTIPFLQNVTFELPMMLGELTLLGGRCQGLQTAGVAAEDLSEGYVLGYGLRFWGVGIACQIDANNNGSMAINATLDQSALNFTIQINSQSDEAAGWLPLDSFNVSDCVADMQFGSITMSGDTPLATLAENMGPMLPSIVGNLINEPLCNGLKDFLETTGTAYLRSAASLWRPFFAPPEHLPVPVALEPLADWGSYLPVVVIQKLFEDRFSLFAGRVVDVVRQAGLNVSIFESDDVNLTMRALEVGGVVNESTYGLAVQGRGPRLGLLGSFADLSLTAGLDVSIRLPGQPLLNQSLDVTMGLTNFSVSLRAFAGRKALESLTVSEALYSPACFVECAEITTTPINQSVAFEDLALSLRPLLHVAAAGPLAQQIAGLINVIGASVYSRYMPAIDALLHTALALLREPLNRRMWNMFENLLPCSKQDPLMGFSPGFLAGLCVTSGALLLLGFIGGAVVQVRRGGAREVGVVPAGDSRCLAMSSCVPVFLRVALPVAIVAVALLFIYADLALAITISFTMYADEHSVNTGPLISFTHINIAYNSWVKGAWYVSMMASLVNGVWPLFKLTALLVAWLAPTSRLSAQRRGKLLRGLDLVGKYAFLDTRAALMALVAFVLATSSIGSSYLRTEMLCHGAFFAFIIAQVLSLTLSHVVIEMDACAACSETSVKDAAVTPVGLADEVGKPPSEAIETAVVTNGSVEAVAADVAAETEEGRASSSERSTQYSSDGSMCEDAKRALRLPLCSFAPCWLAPIALTSVLAAMLVLVIAAAFVTSVEFHVGGIFAEFLFGGQSTDYSIVDIGVFLARAGGKVDMLLLGLAYLLLVVAVPVALNLALLALWAMPLPLREQCTILRVCRAVESWAAFDLTVIALLIGVLAGGPLVNSVIFTQTSLAATCSRIRDLTDTDCFDVGINAKPAFVVPLLAAALSLAVPKLALRLCAQAAAGRCSGAAKKV